jgi:hypothetical protein
LRKITNHYFEGTGILVLENNMRMKGAQNGIDLNVSTLPASGSYGDKNQDGCW